MFYEDNKIIRMLNQNTKLIILIIGIIAFILLLIGTFSYYASTNQEESASNNNTVEDILAEEINKSKDTIMTNTTINDKDAKNNYNLINTFVEYCNNQDIENAYNLLTEECKENLYPTIESFNKNYVQIMFEEEKQIEVRNWNEDNEKYTYLVDFMEDIISTGNYNKEVEFQDYITVVKNEKLNINRYVGREKMERITKKQNIEFEINSVDVFKDYEIYNLKIRNLNNKQIILDDLKSSSNTYILTDRSTKINCASYESGINDFTYGVGVSKQIKLKFIKQYNTNIQDEKMIFSSVILDAENLNNKQDIVIEL